MRQRLVFALFVLLALIALVALGLPAFGGAPGPLSTLGVAVQTGAPESDDGDEEELEEFVPSEEVSADQSVSFPVDI